MEQVKADLKKKERINSIVNKVDEDFMETFIKDFIEIGDNKLWGGVHAGSDSEHEAADFIEAALHKTGVPKVERIPLVTDKFQFNDAKIVAGDRTVFPYAYTAPGTDGISASIIDMGSSTKKDYEGKDVSGKIVLLEAMGFIEGASLSCQIQEAEHQGAAAVIVVATEEVLNDETIRVQPLNYIAKIPVVGVSGKDAEYLRTFCGSNEKIDMSVDTIFAPEGGTTYEIIGEIPGKNSKERILYSAHYDHYFRCVQDDVSAAATLLGIAKAMVESGYQPERTIDFVFTGSHETGNAGSRYPYIAGSWKLLDGAKSSWKQEALMAINFEYTALDLKKIGILSSPELSSVYADFYHYVPDGILAFKPVTKAADSEDYYLFAWADTISYLTNGIPCFMNDSITEQLYDGSSPYIGRDHSNHDDLSAFSKADIKVNTQLFAALGIYCASLPVMPLDFTHRLEALLSAEDIKLLDDLKISSSDLQQEIQALREAGSGLLGKLDDYNQTGISDEEALRINQCTHQANQELIDTLDKINSQDFITTGHRKYIDNISLLEKAKSEVLADDIATALETMKGIDLAGTSLHFSKEILDHTKASINEESLAGTRLWARNRELSSLTFEHAMPLFDNYSPNSKDQILAEIDLAQKSESDRLRESIKEEAKGLHNVRMILEKAGV